MLKRVSFSAAVALGLAGCAGTTSTFDWNKVDVALSRLSCRVAKGAATAAKIADAVSANKAVVTVSGKVLVASDIACKDLGGVTVAEK